MKGKSKKTTKKTMTGKKTTSVAHMISRGATGVALTAGVVAAGAALADKRTRQKLTKGAQGMIDSLGHVAAGVSEQAQEGYRAVAHQVSSTRSSNSRSGRGRGRGRSSRKIATSSEDGK